MRRALREHSRDVLAIFALVAAGVFSASVILANQRVSLPEWVPVLGVDRFEFEGEFQTAQSVTPGQGQSVVVAGIRVGDVTGVRLEEGHAVVEMAVDSDEAELFREDASLLLRPKTGLNDMVVEVDPGTSLEPLEEGTSVPLASTLPNVNPDEVLASLDADTRGFLRLLLADGARGIRGRGKQVAAAFKRFEPTARDLARINRGLAKRRDAIAGAIHNFSLVSRELADNDDTLAAFVDSSNAALEGFASEEAAIRASLRELPGALGSTLGALRSADRFSLTAAPALRRLGPSARALGPALREVRPFLRRTVAPIRDQIRPFTRSVRPEVRNLRRSTTRLAGTIGPLRPAVTNLNQLLNALAFDPPGDAPSSLFWLGWLNHNLNAVFLTQDAHGPLRRGVVQLSCGTRRTADVATLSRPFLRTLTELSRLPEVSEIC